MPSLAARALLGFLAAVLAVLTFHQGAVELYHYAGMAGPAWSMRPVPPYHVPLLIDLCFWGGLYGVVFGIATPWLRPPWLWGIGLGCLAAVVGWLVVAPLKGYPLGFGWHPDAMTRSLLINGTWGLGVGLISPLLMPSAPRRRRRFT